MAAIAPCAHRHGLLHVAAAAPHDPHRVGERDRARRTRAPSTRPGCGRRRTPAGSRGDASSRHAATLTVRIAGCVFSVSRSWSSGPSKIRRLNGSPSASSASANVSRHTSNASASALPIPTACEPCPGKMNAITVSILQKPRCSCWNRGDEPRGREPVGRQRFPGAPPSTTTARGRPAPARRRRAAARPVLRIVHPPLEQAEQLGGHSRRQVGARPRHALRAAGRRSSRRAPR